MVRDSFHKELDRLDQDVVRMGALVERAIDEAVTSLAECDAERARRVQLGDDEIDALFIDIEKRAFALLAKQQPVAGDLRLIMAVVLTVNDLERSGDLAYNVASMVRNDLTIVKLKPIAGLIYELGHASQRLLARSIDAWAKKDLGLAAEMDDLDDEIDDLYAKLLAELFELSKEVAFEVAMNMVLVGRYFERIADHAVNIAERIRYYVTGDAEHLG
jgi:phosphate transport system protein